MDQIENPPEPINESIFMVPKAGIWLLWLRLRCTNVRQLAINFFFIIVEQTFVLQQGLGKSFTNSSAVIG